MLSAFLLTMKSVLVLLFISEVISDLLNSLILFVYTIIIKYRKRRAISINAKNLKSGLMEDLFKKYYKLYCYIGGYPAVIAEYSTSNITQKEIPLVVL